jgi:hypothetical protein
MMDLAPRRQNVRTHSAASDRIFPNLLAAFFLILSASFVLGAQTKGNPTFDTGTRSVSGVVMDAGGKPVAGAVVLLKNAKTLQVRSYLTKEDGTYHFFGLSMNDQFDLRAQRDKQASGSKTLSQFDSRKEAKIDLKLK